MTLLCELKRGESAKDGQTQCYALPLARGEAVFVLASPLELNGTRTATWSRMPDQAPT